jgi:hypothetical protein
MCAICFIYILDYIYLNYTYIVFCAGLSGCVSQISCLFVALDSSVVRMAAPKPISRLISHVILDLDGTLLNTGDLKLGNNYD